MSDEAQNIVQDMDWDNIEDTAPSAEEGITEDVEESENGAIDHEAEDKVEDTDDSSEDTETSQETSDESGKDKPEEKSENTEEDLGDLSKIGLIKQDGEVGKLVTIDGKEEFVPLKELGNDYSGQKAIQKRFSEVDKERKSLQAEVDSINKYVAELGNTMKNVSMVEGLNKIAELNGIAPHQVEQALIKELLPRIQELQGMDEEQVNLQYKQKELEYKEKQLESESNLSAQKQAQQELQNSISQAREAHAINEDEWNDAFKYLDENLDANEEITVDLVSQKVLFDRAGAKTQEVLSSYDGGKYSKDNDVARTLHEIILDNPDFNDQDLKEILDGAYGESQQKKIEDDVIEAKQSKEKKPEQKQTQSQEPKANDSWDIDWDDLD